ncbi:MAG: alpha/beta fold hydrolase [candidate division Zixibacteria bacterium]|nr:alpha/beta fold hydrolase [candidate division Zixibacteria bacterium]
MTKMHYCLLCLIWIMIACISCSEQNGSPAVSSDAVEIAYEVQGEGKSALVFIHGWSNNRTVWDDQIDHFSQNYKVVALDLAGFGESGNNRMSWTVSNFADDVKAVVEELNLDRIILVGFSMGAGVAVETATKMPEAVDGIVVVDHLHDVDAKMPPEAVDNLINSFMHIVNNPTMENTQPFFRHNREENHQRLLAMIQDVPKKGWREMLRTYSKWLNEDVTESLSEIECPVIAINSDQQPTNIDAFRKYVPSFEARIIPDVGHLVMWDAPEKFNNLLEESIQELAKE